MCAPVRAGFNDCYHASGQPNRGEGRSPFLRTRLSHRARRSAITLNRSRAYQAEACMSDEVALLDTVLREPDSDVPRLAYAAWLRQAGGAAGLARSEFIQLQIEIEQLADDDRHWPELARRERELLVRWRSAWEKPLRDLLRP